MTSVLEHHQQMLLLQDIREIAENLATRIGDSVEAAIKADGVNILNHYMNVDEVVHGDKVSGPPSGITMNYEEINQKLAARVVKFSDALDTINRHWKHETTRSMSCELPNDEHSPNSCRTCLAHNALKEDS